MVLGKSRVFAAQSILSLPPHQEADPKPDNAQFHFPAMVYHSIAGVIPRLAWRHAHRCRGNEIAFSWMFAAVSL